MSEDRKTGPPLIDPLDLSDTKIRSMIAHDALHGDAEAYRKAVESGFLNDHITDAAVEARRHAEQVKAQEEADRAWYGSPVGRRHAVEQQVHRAEQQAKDRELAIQALSNDPRFAGAGAVDFDAISTEELVREAFGEEEPAQKQNAPAPDETSAAEAELRRMWTRWTPQQIKQYAEESGLTQEAVARVMAARSKHSFS